jgi:hypothetical protein
MLPINAQRLAADRRTAVMMISVSPAAVPIRKTAMMPMTWGAASHNRSLPMAIAPLPCQLEAIEATEPAQL